MLTVTHFKSYLIKTYLLEKGGDMRGLNATQNSFVFFFFCMSAITMKNGANTIYV